MSLLLAAIVGLVCFSAIYILALRLRRDGTAGKTSALRSGADNGAKRTFTSEEVETHCTADNLWLIIQGKVYDFTDYLVLHPGGEAIMRNAGKDSTTGFSGSQHPTRVWDMIEEFYIGDVEIPSLVAKED